MVFSRKPDPKPVSAIDPRLEPARPLAPQPQTAAHIVTPAAAAAPSDLSRQGDHESIIGNDLAIEGQSITIRCKGSLRVNGNIQADLHSRRLVVGEEAIINGSIAADEVDVLGRVNGAIYGAQVTLHASAEVEGDIHSRSLSIENGASFDGRSRKVLNDSEITPQLESTVTRSANALGAGGGDTSATRSSATVYAPPTARLHA